LAFFVISPRVQDGAGTPVSVQGVGSLYLTISIKRPLPAYRMSDKVELETQLTNSGSGDLYLFDDVCWNPGSALNVHVFTPVGRQVSGKSDLLRDCLRPPPKPDDTNRFTLLKAGASYRDTETFSIRELVPKPGGYDLVVHYDSRISASWIREYAGTKIAALPVWTSEQPTLQSNRLHINVKR